MGCHSLCCDPHLINYFHLAMCAVCLRYFSVLCFQCTERIGLTTYTFLSIIFIDSYFLEPQIQRHFSFTAIHFGCVNSHSSSLNTGRRNVDCCCGVGIFLHCLKNMLVQIIRIHEFIFRYLKYLTTSSHHHHHHHYIQPISTHGRHKSSANVTINNSARDYHISVEYRYPKWKLRSNQLVPGTNYQ